MHPDPSLAEHPPPAPSCLTDQQTCFQPALVNTNSTNMNLTTTPQQQHPLVFSNEDDKPFKIILNVYNNYPQSRDWECVPGKVSPLPSPHTKKVHFLVKDGKAKQTQPSNDKRFIKLQLEIKFDDALSDSSKFALGLVQEQRSTSSKNDEINLKNASWVAEENGLKKDESGMYKIPTKLTGIKTLQFYLVCRLGKNIIARPREIIVRDGNKLSKKKEEIFKLSI